MDSFGEGGILMDPELQRQLRELAEADGIARAFFEYAASRERNRTETPVDRILSMVEQNGPEVSRGDLIRVLRRLEELGCGRYVEGRHGYPSRFAWTISIIEVGRAGLGESAPMVPAPAPVQQAAGTLTHLYNLRADFQVEIELPADLTPREAERLSAFIRSLPIEGEQ
jgi:hypothetical protein